MGDGGRGGSARCAGSASGGDSRSGKRGVGGGGEHKRTADGGVRDKSGADGAAAMGRRVVAASPRLAGAARPSAVEAGIVGLVVTWDRDAAGAFIKVHSSRRVVRALFFS